MKLQSVTDPSFAPYGQLVEGYDFTGLCQRLRGLSAGDGVFYQPSLPLLEEDPVYGEVRDRYFGGMPVQIGICSGRNRVLNCLEYHRDSEINLAADDMVLLLGRQQDILGGTYDTGLTEAFFLPAGIAVELYATTLHYAPMHRDEATGFRAACVLPRGTNTEKPLIRESSQEDRMLFACNKWLLAHPGAPEAKQGAYVGLTGENLTMEDLM